MQRICLFAPDEVTAADLPPELRAGQTIDLGVKACHRCFVEEHMTFDEVMACLEVNLLQQALTQTNGNRTHASQLLNMSPSTFRDKLKEA